VELLEIHDQIRSLRSTGKHGEALLKIIDYEKSGGALSAYLLIMKGDLIQLTDDLDFTLQDAVRCYMSAVELEPKNIEAHEELGWLYFNVLDEPESARNWFERALVLAKERVSKIEEGLTRCEEQSTPNHD
jgi:tetratricopeptide (TPR) repeat protein